MESVDSEKFIVLTSQQKKILLIVSFVLVLVVLPLLMFFYYKLAIDRPSQIFKEVTFYIEEGESVSSIATKLGQAGLVNSEFLFKFYLLQNKLQSKIQAGVYVIPSGTSIKQLAQIFQFGTNDIKITFIEGWRAEEYARLSENTFKKVNYGDFLKLVKDKEGYLFPDTYYFNVEATENEIVAKLLATFDEKTKQLFLSPEFKKSGLTKDQVLIFASIVEREVYKEEDRNIVAGILIKRFLNKELIGADATVQYATAEKNFCRQQDNSAECPNKEQINQIDWWPSIITQEHLDFDSAYNTRKNVGLPPMPISNPSISAIKSVLNATPTTYNYYLTDSKGVSHFANTLDEHNQNILQYLK